MSTVERKEFQETRIMRSRSPIRTTRSSNQNLSQFDSNLDYLLEDLQNSVSRPGSSLGQHTLNNNNTTSSYRESSKYISSNGTSNGYGRTNSLNRQIANVKAANPTTEYLSDDSYSYNTPGGKEKVHAYKKEKYVYGKSTLERDIEPESNRMQNSINQLDSLLDDLQQVKKSSYSEKESYNSTGTDPGFQTTTKTVNRELHYGDTPPSAATSRNRTFERVEEKRLYKNDQNYSGEGTYGDLRQLRPTSPSSRTSTLSKQTKVSNVHEYPLRVVETPVPDIDPEVLAHLDPNLHPAGNTKVTTTIKTYTYEIPGSGSYPTQVKEDTTINEQYLNKDKYSTYSPNESITTPSKSFVYNKIENQENIYQRQQQPEQPNWKVQQSYKELVKNDATTTNYYQKPDSPTGYTVKETVTTRNYQPGYQPDQNPTGPNQTYIYNESTTTKNVRNAAPLPPPATTSSREYIVNNETTINRQRQVVTPPPPRETTREYIVNKETNIINRNQPPMAERGYPVYNPPPSGSKNTYVLKETHTTNYQNGYPSNRQQSPPRDVETFNPHYPPKEPINIHYSYKSTNTTENRYKGGYPSNTPESQPLLPGKFPTDDLADGPPKRIDDLMATIGNEPPNSPLNAGFNAHEKEVANKKVADSMKQNAVIVEDTQKKEPPTKNVTGPPVYYPPGHEMFAKKEEGGGAWRAHGEYEKASGKYMHEAESKSKSKSKKGMAVVPVCLPLCCGLPCTIL